LFVLAACGRVGFAQKDASANPNPELPYIELAPGWSAAVFNDFSDEHSYIDIDLVDPPEMYSNAPASLFVMSSPYPSALAVVAGRDVIELTSSTYAIHHVGATTTPNQTGVPDELTNGVFVPGATPYVLLSSSSATLGDGTFRMTTQWQVSSDTSTNNTRCVAVDATGSFDAGTAAVPEVYYGSDSGVWRRSTQSQLFVGDSKTLKAAGGSLLVTRAIGPGDQRLVKVDSFTAGMYPETELARSSLIELGEGEPPGGIGWAVFDSSRLVSVTATGVVEIARTSDASFNWEAAATPPAGHALATAQNIVYVLESNRTLDTDRILVLTSP
jgi:hypothetical protein